jgi:hypothetical protein
MRLDLYLIGLCGGGSILDLQIIVDLDHPVNLTRKVFRLSSL